jgi:predicted transcriptional regulator
LSRAGTTIAVRKDRTLEKVTNFKHLRRNLLYTYKLNDDSQKDPSNLQQSYGFAYRYMAEKIKSVMEQTKGKFKQPK